jgi:hypothetical protein
MLCEGFGVEPAGFSVPSDGMSERMLLHVLRESGLRCTVYRKLLPEIMRVRLEKEFGKDRGCVLYDMERDHWMLAHHLQGWELAYNDPASNLTQWADVRSGELGGYLISVSES